ncbi:hypothetical protein FCM35_KLT07276 [Carex littledalei]|uniref:Uncharacterized protein n=1 Tax=Carex littledalei TaxID=544730 RepID=A0A833QYG5_9POAL|nr:hypothetical protein FCM35_KLT07276 [Carex littledalei]
MTSHIKQSPVGNVATGDLRRRRVRNYHLRVLWCDWGMQPRPHKARPFADIEVNFLRQRRPEKEPQSLSLIYDNGECSIDLLLDPKREDVWSSEMIEPKLPN